MRPITSEMKRPILWTAGDWNAFFGFGTNILVNMLVLTGLLRFVLKMPDSLVFGRILPALGLMMCLSTVYYASLAGSHIARVDLATGAATVIEPPTAGQGARRVWSDSKGRIWVSEWNAGQLGLYDPENRRWREWKLPGPNPSAYAVFVDDRDIVWLSDFGGNAIVRFDPATNQFESFPIPSRPGNVRQIHGRPGEVWGGLSAVDKLLLIRTR
jgi:streptogramin lyase